MILRITKVLLYYSAKGLKMPTYRQFAPTQVSVAKWIIIHFATTQDSVKWYKTDITIRFVPLNRVPSPESPNLLYIL